MTPGIREVHLRNYRSIEQAMVRLSDFTVLVGPNGSGKTNFVDALAFVRECLSSSIESALRSRGGINQVYYGFADSEKGGIGIRLVIELAPSVVADYGFELVRHGSGGFEVAEERCVISVRGEERQNFEIKGGVFLSPIPGLQSAIERDRLALYAASALKDFRPLYDFLTGIRSYSIQPEKLRDVRDIGQDLALEHEGGNAAAVLDHLREHSLARFQRVQAVLKSVVPSIDVAGAITLGGKQFLLFYEGTSPEDPFPLSPSSISDGTLRMLGLLLAVYQPAIPTVLLIEEPEATIHPAAVDSIMAVLLDAAKRSQVLVTTHSPDVLDYGSLPDASIRVVAKTERGTVIAPVASSSRDAIRERLYSPGELLRVDELNPDISAAASLVSETALFGEPVHTFGEAA